mmetsp:Transcript_84620/g.149769  ORF Transcript_84620/g.149769 Transcript_84620/m.149769 type:complete len:108 (+) Transcript_84620:41-364(+)
MGQVALSPCCPTEPRVGAEKSYCGAYSSDPLPMLLGVFHPDEEWKRHAILPARLEVVLEERDAEEQAELEAALEADARRASLERPSPTEMVTKSEPPRLPIKTRGRR